MRISDWSSDVCSSDLRRVVRRGQGLFHQRHVERRQRGLHVAQQVDVPAFVGVDDQARGRRRAAHRLDLRGRRAGIDLDLRSEEHTSELQSLMRISYAVFCLKTKTKDSTDATTNHK